MSNEINHLRQFGKFRLDVHKKVLWHENHPVELPLKEIELLCVLTEKRGDVVTKNELLERVWSGAFVEESNLSRHIYLLRKTFKDYGEVEDFIQTVPRRGYRFAGEVREVASGDLIIEKHTLTQTLVEEITPAGDVGEEASSAIRPTTGLRMGLIGRRTLIPAALLIVVVIGGLALLRNWSNTRRDLSSIRSIAVLPFNDLGRSSDNDRGGIGIADLLITRLSNIREVKVRPTSAVMIFEDQKTDSITVGHKLGVDAVLEGTIYRAGDRIRVTTRLVRVSDQSPVWSGYFEKPVREELRLQDEIALQVIDALALNLSTVEKTALTKRFTENVDANELYIKGRYEWNKRSIQSLSEAQRLFRNAIEKDPNFALAYVGLADSLLFSYDTVETAAAYGKALELDPNLAEAYATQGFYLSLHEWKWNEAEASFRKAIELDPGYSTAHHWYATLLGIQGKYDEAKAEMRQALEINPLSHNFLADLGQIYYFAHEYDKAKEYCDKALALYPDFNYAHRYLSHIYLETGEYEAAIEEDSKANRSLYKVDTGPSGVPDDEAKAVAEMKALLQKVGIRGFFEHNINVNVQTTQDPSTQYGYAAIHAFLGDKALALDELEKACQARPFSMAWVKANPFFDSLRAEPRYQAILHRMGLS